MEEGEASLSDEAGLPASQCTEEHPRIASSVKEMVRLALPQSCGYVMALANELTNTIILGHAGDDATLAAVGLANMMQNCVALSIGFGLTSALDTLVSQAHGAGQHQLSCYYLQRSRVINLLVLFWMIPVLWYSEPLLRFIHEDPEVCRKAGEYNRASVFSLLPSFQFESGKKFLQNRCNTMPAMVICVCGSALHIVWCALFVFRLQLGNAGAGYAVSLTYWLQMFALAAYLWWTAPGMGLPRVEVLLITRKALGGWIAYLRVALPSLIQTCTEWWFFEICALVVGYLGKVALAAHVGTMTFITIAFMPGYGISSSSATLVGNALGANQPRHAKLAAQLGVGLTLLIWCVIGTLIACGHRLLAQIFSDDMAVRAKISVLLLIYLIAGFSDSTQNVLGGILRGIGLQASAALITTATFYCVMLPTGCVLAFSAHLGVEGIWYSFTVGTALALVLQLVVLSRVDWQAQAAKASEEMRRAGGEQPSAATSAMGVSLVEGADAAMES